MCDLNQAPVDEIEALPGVDRDHALGLTLWRPYASWAEVETVPGVDHAAVEALKAAGAVLSPVDAPPWPPSGGVLGAGGRRQH